MKECERVRGEHQCVVELLHGRNNRPITRRKQIVGSKAEMFELTNGVQSCPWYHVDWQPGSTLSLSLLNMQLFFHPEAGGVCQRCFQHSDYYLVTFMSKHLPHPRVYIQSCKGNHVHKAEAGSNKQLLSSGEIKREMSTFVFDRSSSFLCWCCLTSFFWGCYCSSTTDPTTPGQRSTPAETHTVAHGLTFIFCVSQIIVILM